MSQPAITDPTTMDSEDALPSALPSEESDPVNTSALPSSSETGALAVVSYTDRLMDELFEEVEGMLDRGGKLPPEPAKPDYVSLQPITIPKLATPSALIPRPHSQEEEPDLDELISLSAATDIPNQRWGFGKSIDKLLLLAACASVIATAGLWFTFQNRWQQAAVPVASQPAQGSDSQAEADADFLEYIKRSLDVIDRKAQANRQIATAPGTAPTGTNPTLPTLSVPGTITPPPATAPALERVYVPVYQPPQPTVSGSSTPPTAPTAAAPATPTGPATASTGSVPNIAPATSHTLLGVFQSTDPARSTALFGMNGTVQRVGVGETIGSSGWALVSVEGDEAIVRRNGEVRSIYPGQQF